MSSFPQQNNSSLSNSVPCPESDGKSPPPSANKRTVMIALKPLFDDLAITDVVLVLISSFTWLGGTLSSFRQITARQLLTQHSIRNIVVLTSMSITESS